MTLKIPGYIKNSGIVGLPANYSWDKDVVTKIQDYSNNRVQKLVLECSLMANIAIGLGVTEWIAWRLNNISTRSQETLDFIEAYWVWMIDRRYLARDEIKARDLFENPADGALNLANSMLYSVITRSLTDNPVRGNRTARLTALARHTITNVEAFDNWFTFCLKRLVNLYPQDGGPSVNKAIPHQLLDPDFEYENNKRIKCFKSFLNNISPERNPFLVESEKLVKSGFEGTPYKLEI